MFGGSNGRFGLTDQEGQKNDKHPGTEEIQKHNRNSKHQHRTIEQEEKRVVEQNQADKEKPNQAPASYFVSGHGVAPNIALRPLWIGKAGTTRFRPPQGR